MFNDNFFVNFNSNVNLNFFKDFFFVSLWPYSVFQTYFSYSFSEEFYSFLKSFLNNKAITDVFNFHQKSKLSIGFDQRFYYVLNKVSFSFVIKKYFNIFSFILLLFYYIYIFFIYFFLSFISFIYFFFMNFLKLLGLKLNFSFLSYLKFIYNKFLMVLELLCFIYKEEIYFPFWTRKLESKFSLMFIYEDVLYMHRIVSLSTIMMVFFSYLYINVFSMSNAFHGQWGFAWMFWFFMMWLVSSIAMKTGWLYWSTLMLFYYLLFMVIIMILLKM